ncbi:MAG: tryptophan--tRNA ligase [Cycloclasticus sp.]|nr:tryptophan--tRNA ligase [Cycloclasticus sp.]
MAKRHTGPARLFFTNQYFQNTRSIGGRVNSEVPAQYRRVLSGMRPTGRLHLGHYHGVLKNWLELQQEYKCYFFVADWHALTTHYEDPSIIADSTWEMVIDWLAAGVDHGLADLFIQSSIPEHAELHLLLSMMTPLGWLERVPSYKDQQEKLKEKDLATYGFLGYPLLQSADIMMYKAGLVPVGADQVAHVELTREVARRFNHLYGREPGFEEKAEAAIKKMGKKNAKMFNKLRTSFQEGGDQEALGVARALLEAQQNITVGDKERLFGYLEGSGRVILPEPQALLTKASKMPGLDGQKMSKSYGNTIALREAPEDVEKKLRTMPTDPARVRRTDPGDPAKCPVWQFHEIYSDDGVREWAKEGCQTAGIGCIDCKQPVIDAVLRELKPMQERAREYTEQPDLVRSIINEGNEKARDVAKETLDEVKSAMGMNYL